MARRYDLVMTHLLDTDDFFIHRIQENAANRGLNFFLIEPTWVAAFLEKFRKEEICVGVLLNMHSEHHLPEDIYHQLVRAAAEKGVAIIDPPDIAKVAFDKAQLQGRLEKAGLRTPFTVVVPNELTASFRLSDEQRHRLGSSFVVKPSMGYGRRGLVLDATSEADIIRSVQAWPSPAYLVQEKIVARSRGGHPSYFRVFYVFGSIWCCWWNCFTDEYRLMSGEEVTTLGLNRLQEIVFQVAGLTGMNFFSSEIAETAEGELVLIDYVNDQCHMLSQRANPRLGVPDELVARIAQRLVEGALLLLARQKSAT